MASKHIVLVTIHGVGFQQAPENGIPGYADMLHDHLRSSLNDAAAAPLLGDDPIRLRERGERGPVYVQSSWPPDSRDSEGGLQRLGSWGDQPREVSCAEWPLADDAAPIAHVALVYSHLEDQQARLGALAETTAKTIFSLGHYASVQGAVRIALADVRAMVEHHAPAAASGETVSSLRVRSAALKSAAQNGAVPPESQASSGLLTTLWQLDEDVATYICRNDLRERVRSFVRDALLRLIFREDVAGIIVNAHSQGTVLAFDVLSQLPSYAASRVLWFVTAGSPLRKYADIFCWGNQIVNIQNIGQNTQVAWDAVKSEKATVHWANFWDARDPVADPLTPAAWPLRSAKRRGERGSATLLQWTAADGTQSDVRIADQQVGNVEHSVGGGLQAHNYWDNQTEVVEPLAQLLRRLAGERVPRQVAAAPEAEPVAEAATVPAGGSAGSAG